MLKKTCICVFALLMIFAISAFAEGEVSVSAGGAVLINANTKEVIFEKDSKKRMSMASTTKIMTSIIAIEQDNGQQLVKISDEVANVEGSSMGLKSGDLVDMNTLIYGMLLESGNDAATAVAIEIGNNLDDFAVLMNKKAKEIGMNDSNFVTPSGLDDPEHYSTAYDMALLGAYAISNPRFTEISSTKSKVVSFGNPETKRTLYNHNKMLKTFEGSTGIKTGFTKKSGRCLVTSATRGDVTLVAVVLNDGNDWDDTRNILEYGFEKTKAVDLDTEAIDRKVKVIGGKNSFVNSTLSHIPTYQTANLENVNITKTVEMKQFEYAPIKVGDILGYLCYYNDGKLIQKVPMLATENVDQLEIKKSKVTTLFDKIKIFFNKIKETIKNGKR